MKAPLFVAAALAVAAMAFGESSEEEIRVREAVAAFYADVNDGDFRHADRYATLDWAHIGADGGQTRGRETVVAKLRNSTSASAKTAIVTAEETNVRFATADVAIVTVIDRQDDERYARTLVVVKQKGRWRIAQDQSTRIGR